MNNAILSLNEQNCNYFEVKDESNQAANLRLSLDGGVSLCFLHVALLPFLLKEGDSSFGGDGSGGTGLPTRC